jgi:hypothetical protein
MAAALLAGATAANAQTTVITSEPVQIQAVVTTERPLRLTPVQRRTIYRTIVRERVAPAEPTVEYRVGTPAVKTYRTIMVNNSVVLIDPATGEVVDEFID